MFKYATSGFAIVAFLLFVSFGLSGCVNHNELAKKIGQPPQGALELRVLQTRRFASDNEATLLHAGLQTLQDLGYTISESTADAGVLVGSKQRDAKETGQIAGQVALTIVFAMLGSYYQPIWDENQTINATLVATPIKNSKQTEVRVSFDRHLVNNQGHLWRAELILDEKIYQEFFDKLSQSAFLEAQKI